MCDGKKTPLFNNVSYDRVMGLLKFTHIILDTSSMIKFHHHHHHHHNHHHHHHHHHKWPFEGVRHFQIHPYIKAPVLMVKKNNGLDGFDSVKFSWLIILDGEL